MQISHGRLHFPSIRGSAYVLRKFRAMKADSGHIGTDRPNYVGAALMRAFKRNILFAVFVVINQPMANTLSELPRA